MSPKWFQRFVLPDLKAQAESLDYAIYHLDGPNELPYLDDLLKVDAITGIQGVPGINQTPEGSDHWLPVYKKIQAADKRLVTGCQTELLPHFLKQLDPSNLFVSLDFGSEIVAEMFLPKYLGGRDGEDED